MIKISLKNVPHKEQHSHAHGLLKELLKKYNIDYNSETAIGKNRYGKPFLADYPHIHFNVSHARGIAACIVESRECGIDCEQVRKYPVNVPKRVFADSELAILEAAPVAEKDLLFFRLWTLKEAYVKAIGQGISYPMNKVIFSFENGEIVCSDKNYKFRQYILKNGQFVVSTAIYKINS
ncbi:MAG: 4'-phosphopantetheinyl transferase superfamily protein [Ruminococcus sp.]|nr:4'-phosphopantetheinyl transferase superfamily protein [Ruminococcus sp.]